MQVTSMRMTAMHTSSRLHGRAHSSLPRWETASTRWRTSSWRTGIKCIELAELNCCMCAEDASMLLGLSMTAISEHSYATIAPFPASDPSIYIENWDIILKFLKVCIWWFWYGVSFSNLKILEVMYNVEFLRLFVCICSQQLCSKMDFQLNCYIFSVQCTPDNMTPHVSVQCTPDNMTPHVYILGINTPIIYRFFGLKRAHCV